jgi:hypothetical protein
MSDSESDNDEEIKYLKILKDISKNYKKKSNYYTLIENTSTYLYFKTEKK